MTTRKVVTGILGRHAVVFDESEVVQLLKAAVDRENGQVAFARRHGLDRVHINRLLKGKRTNVTEAISSQV
jgi:hypothetical protein